MVWPGNKFWKLCLSWCKIPICYLSCSYIHMFSISSHFSLTDNDLLLYERDLNSASQPCCNYFDLPDLLVLIQTSAHKLVPHSKAKYSVWEKSSHPCSMFFGFVFFFVLPKAVIWFKLQYKYGIAEGCMQRRF